MNNKGFCALSKKTKKEVLWLSFKICGRRNHNKPRRVGQEVYESSHVTMVQAGQDVYVSCLDNEKKKLKPTHFLSESLTQTWIFFLI